MATTSKASATWEGFLRSGKGRFEAGSGAFKGDYTFATRFEGAQGTNPEELLAAAHAACFSMALSVGLERAGTPATRITTTAHCTVDKVGEGFQVTTMRLDVRGVVPGATAAAFQAAAEGAKTGCPISGVMAGNVKVEMEARLEP
ncbi:MAG TPA: OsmC family peroxiredoxin [Gemmatimonadales bacterium]|nr:OsmC family peroxiredoxin [Gemmatimonadales bacterium]